MSESWEKCDACGKEAHQWVDDEGCFTCESCGAENQLTTWMDDEETLENSP